jgi:FkbM family methyltransferase
MLKPYLHAGDGVLDIGGFDGAYAKTYARIVGPTGHVVSVEPDPDSVQAHRNRNAPYPWVEVIEAAVFARSGKCALYRDGTSRACNSLYEKNCIQMDGAAVIEMITLDDAASRVRNLKAIKIDAQGAEVQILMGGIETLMRDRLAWQVELWPRGLINAGTSVKALAQMFEEHGWVPNERTWARVLEDTHRCDDLPHKSIDVVLVKGTT